MTTNPAAPKANTTAPQEEGEDNANSSRALNHLLQEEKKPPDKPGGPNPQEDTKATDKSGQEEQLHIQPRTGQPKDAEFANKNNELKSTPQSASHDTSKTREPEELVRQPIPGEQLATRSQYHSQARIEEKEKSLRDHQADTPRPAEIRYPQRHLQCPLRSRLRCPHQEPYKAFYDAKQQLPKSHQEKGQYAAHHHQAPPRQKDAGEWE